MSTDPTRRDGQEPQAPAKLVAALKESSSRRVFVPLALDEAVLDAARRHLARPRPKVFRFFRSWLVWPATAAACLLLVGLGFFIVRQRGASPEFAREDLNHDGRVDVLDAFQLARQLQSGSVPASAVDLNGDGVVDRRDAELIAAHAVKLDKGGKS